MPRSYASQFRSMVVEEVRSGRRVAEVAASIEVPDATVFRWVRQDRIDRGELLGTSTRDCGTPRGVTTDRRVRGRAGHGEASLGVVAEGRVVRPKALFGIVETLAREGHGTKRVCRLVRVAPSGFFCWRNKPPSDRAIRRADLIGEIHEQSRRTYGWRRVRAELDDAYGQTVNKKLIQSIMREFGIAGLPTRRRGKPNLINRAATVDLVNRDFDRDGPNQLWMTDITEHPTRRASSIAVSCSTPGRARSLAGRSIGDPPPRWSTPRSAWRSTTPTPQRHARTQITARNTRHGRSANASAAPAQPTRSARSATCTTTPWSSRSGAACRPSCSTRGVETRVELSSAIFDWIEAFYNRTRRHSRDRHAVPGRL